MLLEYIRSSSLSDCLAQVFDAESSCTADYDAHAVTDSIVLLFSKCQVCTYNRQGTQEQMLRDCVKENMLGAF